MILASASVNCFYQSRGQSLHPSRRSSAGSERPSIGDPSHTSAVRPDKLPASRCRRSARRGTFCQGYGLSRPCHGWQQSQDQIGDVIFSRASSVVESRRLLRTGISAGRRRPSLKRPSRRSCDLSSPITSEPNKGKRTFMSWLSVRNKTIARSGPRSDVFVVMVSTFPSSSPCVPTDLSINVCSQSFLTNETYHRLISTFFDIRSVRHRAGNESSDGHHVWRILQRCQPEPASSRNRAEDSCSFSRSANVRAIFHVSTFLITTDNISRL